MVSESPCQLSHWRWSPHPAVDRRRLVRAGAGPRRHRRLLRCTVTPRSVHCTCTFYTALLIHFALQSTDWRSHYLINQSIRVGIIGLYVSMTVKVWDPQSAASADKPLSCTNVDTVELCNTMHRPVSCILEYFQLNAVVSARLCSVKICYKGFSTFEFRPPPTSSRHSRARSAISYNIAKFSGLKIVTFLNLLCFNFSLSTFDGVLN